MDTLLQDWFTSKKQKRTKKQKESKKAVNESTDREESASGAKWNLISVSLYVTDCIDYTDKGKCAKILI